MNYSMYLDDIVVYDFSKLNLEEYLYGNCYGSCDDISCDTSCDCVCDASW